MATGPAIDHIEKCGYLKIKRPPTSGKVRLKAWQSKYFVLRDHPPVFEYFKDELSYHMTRSTKEKNKISLENVIHIGTTDASKTQRNAFMIVDSHHGALMLASDSEQDTKEWIEALNRVAIKMSPQECPDLGSLVYPDQSPPLPTRWSMSSVSPLASPVLGTDSGMRRASAPPTSEVNNQGFLVTARLTPSSEKNGIRENYKMHITDEHVVLHRLDSQTPVVSWPIVGLRGWKSEPAESAGRRGTQLLTLESGRKSATGEGVFQFFTNFGDQIASKIRTHSNVLYASAVEKREKFKQDRSNSFEDLEHSSSCEENIKKATTEPRPSSQKQTPPNVSHKFTLPSRSESDSLLNFDKGERQRLSPASLRKDLLQGICTKDMTAKDTDNSESPPANDVFTAQPTDNAYLDLIAESGVEPVHISDPGHRRTSTNSEEGALILKCQIPAINETNEPSDYIDDCEINVYGAQKSKFAIKDDLKNDVNSIEGRGFQIQDDHDPYSDPTVLKATDITKQASNSPETQFCQKFFEQLSNPTVHRTIIFPQQQNQLKSPPQAAKSPQQRISQKETKVSSDTNSTGVDLLGKPSQSNHVLDDAPKPAAKSSVTCQGKGNGLTDVANQSNEESRNFPPKELNPCLEKNNSEESANEESLSPTDIEFADESVSEPQKNANFHRLLKRSDETQDFVQRFFSQLESPQTCAQQHLFQHFSKRNSTGNVATENLNLQKTNNEKLKTKSLTVSSELGIKKNVEKSKSHSGFDSKLPADKPPPLPARKDMTGQTRARTSASMGDIFENIQRRPEQFPKGINRQHSPIGSHTPAFGASCGPESLVSARLLQRTESGSNLVFGDKRSTTHLSIHDSQNDLKTSINEINRPRSSSLRSSRDSSSRSCEDDRSTDNEGEGSKGRRGSKATKFLNKVFNNFSLTPVATTKRRASCDCLSPDALKDVETRARSDSVAPGIDNEGWSPESSLDVPTPEGSPKHFRKSISALRRASHDPLLGRKNFLVGSPTFDIRNEEVKQKARERERERSELPHQPPPALPPRKKSDPPPLPPRRRRSSGDHSYPSPPPSRIASHEQSQSVKTTNSKGSGLRGSGVGISHDDQSSPPPIPPRRDERRGSHPPSIQLTASSPENKTLDNSLDGLPEEPPPTSSLEGASGSGQKSAEAPMANARPPTISSTPNMDTDVSCPVPKRPPKGKGHWTRQQTLDLLDSSSVDEEISGPRDLSYEGKRADQRQESCEGTSKLEKMESAFTSIENQERAQGSQVERLEVFEIELDSLISSKNVSTNIIASESREPGPHERSRDETQRPNSVTSLTDMTDSLTPPLHPVGSLGSKGTSGRCSPGHSPPLSLKKPKRGSVLVLGDSGPTTPISV